MWGFGVAILLAGCSAGPGPIGAESPPLGTAPSGPVERTIEADWDDLEAALTVALSACELATEGVDSEMVDVVRTDEFSAEGYADRVEVARVWTLLTKDGRAGRLEVRRSLEHAKRRGPAEIELSARIGPFGARGEEACLLDAMLRRLERLRGRVVAPVG